MHGRAERLRGSMQVGLTGIASCLALAACATPAAPPQRGFASEPVRQIVATARAAMLKEGSVSTDGTGTEDTAGRATATITEADYAGPKSGSQVLTVAFTGTGSDQLASAWTVDVDGQIFVEATSNFWTTSIGIPSAQAAVLAGRWVQIPATSNLYTAAGADLTMPSLAKDLFDATSYQKGSVKEVDGVSTIAITYTNGGADSGPATCYVATGGAHLPVLADIGGLQLRFSSWGKAMKVTAPEGAVPLSSLLSSRVFGHFGSATA